jgi:hypothetical protein
MLNSIVGLLDAGIPASTNSYESISTVPVGAGGTSTITFSSIPSTYKHLQIRGLVKFGAASYGNIRFNGDTTAANYRSHGLFGNGSTATANTAANAAYSPFDGAAQWGSFVLDILDYTNTSKYKTTRELGGWDNNGSGLSYLASNLWMSTSAINQIVFTTPSTFQEYSSFALYGIKG